MSRRDVTTDMKSDDQTGVDRFRRPTAYHDSQGYGYGPPVPAGWKDVDRTVVQKRTRDLDNKPRGDYYYSRAVDRSSAQAERTAATPPTGAPIIINNFIYNGDSGSEGSSELDSEDSGYSDENAQSRARRELSPERVRVVQNTRERLSPEIQRDRARSPMQPHVMPAAARPGASNPPIIINNRIYNDQSDSEEGLARARRKTKSTERSNRSAEEIEKNRASPKRDQRNEPLTVRLDPLSAQDVTVHVELESADDIEAPLEEFARLRRLGHYHEAIEYFHAHLHHFIDNRYVLIQYGECLFDMKDYKTLAKLSETYPGDPHGNTVQIAWHHLLCHAAFTSGMDMPGLSDIRHPIEEIVFEHENWSDMSSTEIQALIHAANLRERVTNPEHKVQWQNLHKRLLLDGRIWELKDVLWSLVQSCGIRVALSLVLGEESWEASFLDMVERIHQDLATDDLDEVNSPALVEIFSILAMELMNEKNNYRSALASLKVSHGQAQKLALQDPRNLKTRPYLLWLMAQATFQQYKNPKLNSYFSLESHLEQLPGTTTRRYHGTQFTLIYAPKEDEYPGWHPDPANTSRKVEATFQAVKMIAEDLGDVSLQVDCLQQLIYSSPHPEQLVEELNGLWSSSGSFEMSLALQVSRYIFANTPSAREELRRDLLIAGDFPYLGSLSYAHDMVLRALSTRPNQKAIYMARAQERNSRADSPAPAAEPRATESSNYGRPTTIQPNTSPSAAVRYNPNDYQSPAKYDEESNRKKPGAKKTTPRRVNFSDPVQFERERHAIEAPPSPQESNLHEEDHEEERREEEYYHIVDSETPEVDSRLNRSPLREWLDDQREPPDTPALDDDTPQDHDGDVGEYQEKDNESDASDVEQNVPVKEAVQTQEPPIEPVPLQARVDSDEGGEQEVRSGKHDEGSSGSEMADLPGRRRPYSDFT
ncbi:hypothetical protein GQ53DRAFT_805128 [Thozetella sp. PMI_491]|nr:hypothetical protein GQ53DRAFT_805128 [Thozetella sp. PMI_491]